MSRAWRGDVSAVAITAAGTSDVITAIEIPHGAEYLWVEIENNAHKALDSFLVSYRPHPDASYHLIASAASDYTTSMQEPILGATCDFASLALSTTGMLRLYVKGIDAVKFAASSASGSDTTVDARWSIR